ncbi:helix-turn-helix domain-containing protein (plasmid) [Amycolatopsis sp. FU40]|uniref:helix-turn-helix domain-containing protein n=1 Tax=Amycolatopsis sp. FU40 TaxID=2914159 RepID=UPI001F1D51D0|nr:helix-turn-helix transcriptional regulator [Amycolatopsis sp. FU40]UKD50720.1 helix-turn-helix domain-containing protein [Amycolatopsis sp. FU40]
MNEHYQRVLGDELRKLRRSRGWTRKELNAHLESEISLQTLATYELGTRQCSVVRLVELCMAMDELPHDLLAKVHSRVYSEPIPEDVVRLDVAALLGDPDDDGPLAPLHRWARGRADLDAGRAEIDLQPETVESLAQVCDVSVAELLWRLRPYAPLASADDPDVVTAVPE